MYTEQLLEAALKDPNLAPPGGCKYVNENGKRCIASTVLSNLGVPDEILSGPTHSITPVNGLTLRERLDLREIIDDLGLDYEMLVASQYLWDSPWMRGFDVVCAPKAIKAYTARYLTE